MDGPPGRANLLERIQTGLPVALDVEPLAQETGHVLEVLELELCENGAQAGGDRFRPGCRVCEDEAHGHFDWKRAKPVTLPREHEESLLLEGARESSNDIECPKWEAPANRV